MGWIPPSPNIVLALAFAMAAIVFRNILPERNDGIGELRQNLKPGHAILSTHMGGYISTMPD